MVAVLVLAGAQPAPAAARPRVTLAFASPSQGAKVNDTVDISFTGTNLTAVRVLRLGRPIATATVSPDGRSAVAAVDTAQFRDGLTVLSAWGWGAGHSVAPQVFAVPLVLRVTNATADHHLPGYRKTVLRDEFSGTELNRSIWCTRFPYEGGPALEVPDPGCLSADGVAGRLDTLGLKFDSDGNQVAGQEDQVYRDFNVDGAPMHTVQDGYLSLHATATRPDDPFLKYESAMIRSKKEIEPTAGHSLYLTARVRLPSMQGTWPAFWLAPGFSRFGSANWPPEIDILEGALNVQDDKVNMLHINAINGGVPGGQTADGHSQLTYADPDLYDPQWQNYIAPSSIRDRWTEVGMEWTVDGMCWYVEGTKISCQNYHWQTNEGTQSNPATVMLNLAVGGPWAGRYGVDVASFPTRYDIDHVRIYQQ
ncbi:glycoside hydrolase family 16 protein [Asanoa ferruginea]|uniref:glycoside hydrolase family 16 protein n=1 Tax=Asanoa ferruginea TaxID=53367 RepID=UPI00147718E0|nr:glycoside hydrolase family 16 protein [Asanoa ferruginea]